MIVRRSGLPHLEKRLRNEDANRDLLADYRRYLFYFVQEPKGQIKQSPRGVKVALSRHM